MRAEEIQGVSTLSSGVKCAFHVQKTVVQLSALQRPIKLSKIKLQFIHTRVHLHESQGKSKLVDCTKQSKMFLLCCT